MPLKIWRKGNKIAHLSSHTQMNYFMTLNSLKVQGFFMFSFFPVTIDWEATNVPIPYLKKSAKT